MASMKGLMRRHIVAVCKDTSVGSAVKLMKRSHITVVPVVGNKDLVGVLTMEEAEKEPPEMKISDMKLRLVYVNEDDKPEAAARLMVEHNLCRLPVVDSDGEMRCIGVVTSTDIARSHKKRIF
jgi:CBS domain-containing protein